jgi:disulfide oxidoreductase YuzD
MPQKKNSTTICSHCLNDINSKEIYWVNRWMFKSAPEHGQYSAPYCEKCLKATDTYVDISKEPKTKAKK